MADDGEEVWRTLWLRGYTTQEIADRCGWTRGWVATRVRKAGLERDQGCDRTTGFVWTKKRVELLKQKFRSGVCDTQIADALGITRNAVASKRHRLGLQRDATPDFMVTKPGTGPGLRASTERFETRLEDLDAHGCKWADGHQRFCNARRESGRAYCPAHSARAFVKAKPRKKGHRHG